MMRQDPTRAVRLEIIPPEHQEPASAPSTVRPYVYGNRPEIASSRAVSDVVLATSWERERGDSGDPNPFETLVRKATRSEEHTSELQSLMRRAYALICWKKKKHKIEN